MCVCARDIIGIRLTVVAVIDAVSTRSCLTTHTTLIATVLAGCLVAVSPVNSDCNLTRNSFNPEFLHIRPIQQLAEVHNYT